MSTDAESFESFSDSNASRFEVRNDKISDTLASGQAQKLIAKQKGKSSLALAGDNGMENINELIYLEKQAKSLNGGLEQGIGTKHVGGESNESEKVLVDGEEELGAESEKDSDETEKELHVEKGAEPDMVCSHGVDLSDVKVSDVRLDSEDLVEDRKPNGTKDEHLDVLCFMGLEPQESRHVTEMVESSESDLVWAKVRSYPWWPGQVFDASAATDKAKKYFKKGSFLVTYFGDCSFTWNDVSRIKPFQQHFSQMAKQSSLPDFTDAIGFALEEVSRRIEFGLACSCISEEVYQKIKTQNIINPGIREDSSSIQGGDKVSRAIFFKPAKLVEYVKCLACSPNCDVTDSLQLVSQRARLLAFNRWKGYTDLPEFVTLQGSVESAPMISSAEEDSSLVKVSDPELEKSKQVYTKRRKTEDQDDCNHKRVFEYEDTTVPKKKRKTLAEYLAQRRLSKCTGNISHEDPMLESRDLKDSSKEHIVNEDQKEAAEITDEITIKDSNLTGEKNCLRLERAA